MKSFFKKIAAFFCIGVAALLISNSALAQTDQDAIMMSKNNFCVGLMYGYGSWKNYWEGTYKRDNENLGRVSSQMVGLMGNYGIKRNLNILFNVPYISNKASAGTLHPMHGIQDLSLWAKWMPVKTSVGNGALSVFAIGGVSTPLTDYTPDLLPLSIGLHSTNLTARVMADYELGKFFVTASGTYTHRNNITIDRNAYYTTELHLTNDVEMPDVASVNFRTGYRSGHLIAEAVVNSSKTLGGFDIRKNDMPFASNEMNATTAGAAFKYTFKKIHQLSLVGSANYVIAGRNVGQSFSVSGGVFYAFNVKGTNKKEEKSKSN
jgi:hypothetical protein